MCSSDLRLRPWLYAVARSGCHRWLRAGEAGLDEAAGLLWATRSIQFAFDQGATVVSLIPTRAGNGAMETLQARGLFSPPKLATLESAHAYGIQLQRGRVFADLWDLEQFSECAQCFAPRRDRLHHMNLEQALLEPVPCSACGSDPRASATPPPHQ